MFTSRSKNRASVEWSGPNPKGHKPKGESSAARFPFSVIGQRKPSAAFDMVTITTNPTGMKRANGASRSTVSRPAHRERGGAPCVSIVGFDHFELDRALVPGRDRASLMYGSAVGAQRDRRGSLDTGWTGEDDAGTGLARCA
jgi:hypothetical protein